MVGVHFLLGNTCGDCSMTKTEAIDKVLRVINNRLAMMSKPMREEAFQLCEEYAITARELLERTEKKTYNT